MLKNFNQPSSSIYQQTEYTKTIHKFFKVTILSIQSAKNTNTDTISLYVYKNSP